MNQRRLVTRKQAEKLKELGFKEKVCHYQMSDLSVGVSYPRDWNNEAVPYGLDNIVNYPYLSIPTVDEALDWLLKRIKKWDWYYHVYMDKTISVTLVNHNSTSINSSKSSVWPDAIKILSISLNNATSMNYRLDKPKNLNVEKRSIITRLIKFIKNDEKI